MATVIDMNELKQDIGRYPATIDLMSEWSESLVSRFSAAMRARRKELDLSVQDVANRTVELGHPISRSTLSGLENNRNKDRLALPDALAIAEVLHVPMLYLLFPEQPDGEVELVPGLTFPSETAIGVITGETMPTREEDQEVRDGKPVFVGRGKELESGYALSTAVSKYTALRQEIMETAFREELGITELKEEAARGDEWAAAQLREHRLRIELLDAVKETVRSKGGVVEDEEWLPRDV